MDGIQCAKIIRTIPKYKNVPIVIVSAHLNMIKDSSIITETMAKAFLSLFLVLYLFNRYSFLFFSLLAWVTLRTFWTS